MAPPVVGRRPAERLVLPVAVAKAWSLPALLAAALAGTVACAAVPGAVGVPGRGEVAELVWPLAAGPLAVVLPNAGGRLVEGGDLLARRGALGVRLRFLCCVAVLASPLLGYSWVRYPFGVAGRNAALLVGLGLLSTWAVPRRLRWLPGSLFLTAMWFFGPSAGGRPPASWAVLLQPPGDTRALQVAVATCAAGTASFLIAPRTWA